MAAVGGDYSVTKSLPELVPPSSPTPAGSLRLSSLDTMGGDAALPVNFIQVFPACASESPSEVLRSALAKALVHYYPVAGRIAEGVAGEPVVECSGEGVWYVAATASCSLAEVNGLQRPLLVPKEQLLPRPPATAKADDYILMAQVTEFACGGCAVGIVFNHLVFDGIGAGQFLNAVGEMARGLLAPTVEPVWHRGMIPTPPAAPPALGPPPPFTDFDFDKSVVDVPLSSITRIKDDFFAQTGDSCSAFDVVTAMLWKCRVAAVAAPPSATVCLGFAASTRRLLRLHGVLPAVDGYYGNCVYLGAITKGSEEVTIASITDIVGFVREAKEVLSARFVNWMNGITDSELNVPLDYSTLVVTDWRRTGFDEVDYGWGKPDHVMPLNDDNGILPVAFYLRPPAPKQGVRLLLQCMGAPHAAALRGELLKLL